MSPLRQFGKVAAWSSLLVLTVAAGCSRPATVQGAADARTDQPQAPVDNGSQDPPINSSQESSVEAPDSAQDLPGVLFDESHSLPAGTLLTVRLNKSISADGPDASPTFDATVEEPVVLNGVTLVPRGAAASGRLESARASTVQRDRGYLRVTLASINIDGRDVRVQTSSVFARANTGSGRDFKNDSSANAIRLDKGRRLTFRLTKPVYGAGDPSIPAR
jgi:hypothetical protein